MISKLALNFEKNIKDSELTTKELIFIFNVIWNLLKDRNVNIKGL